MKKILVLLALMVVVAVTSYAEEKRLSLPESTINKVFTYLSTKPYRESAPLIKEIQNKARIVKKAKAKLPAKIKRIKAKAKVAPNKIEKKTSKTKTTK